MQPLENAVSERTAARVDAFNMPLSDLPAVEPGVAEPASATTTPDAVASASAGEAFALTPPHNPAQMRVTKRNGGQEIVDVNKIVSIRCAWH
jgi:ribonucleoside-diphosphate reductase alpha chain